MIATQTGAFHWSARLKGTARVLIGVNRCGAWAALATAVALGGCANVDYEAGGWFSRPLDLFGRKGGYTYSELQETRKQRSMTGSDLVDASGACPPPRAAQAAPAQANPGAVPAAPPQPDSLLGGGIALGMSECDVVYRAGAPGSVQIGQKPNGDRTAVLTYNAGPRPGIYHFEGGALMTIDRVAEPAPAPDSTKKKPASKPSKNNQA
jgi:hypothetical protein